MNCRCCGKPMRSETQGTKPKRLEDGSIVFTESIQILTCDTPKDDCVLSGQTFVDRTYLERDLSAYGFMEE